MNQKIELTKESREELIRDLDQLCENIKKRIKEESVDARIIKAIDMIYDTFDMLEDKYIPYIP